jgi:hypothetical protein
MKFLYSELEHLNDINTRINNGMKNDIVNYNAVQYAEILENEDGFYILLDETDSRNPLKYLTVEELDLLQDYEPITEEEPANE